MPLNVKPEPVAMRVAAKVACGSTDNDDVITEAILGTSWAVRKVCDHGLTLSDIHIEDDRAVVEIDDSRYVKLPILN